MRNEIKIDIHSLVRYLLSRWMNIGIAVLLAATIGLAGTMVFITPVYEAQSMIYITTTESNVVQNMLSSLQAGNALTADYKTLAISKPVIKQVIDELDLDMTYEELKENIAVENPNNTRVLTLKVKDTDPNRAKKIAGKLTEVERDKIEEIMGMSKPSVMQEADVETKPVSSSPIRNAALCGLISLVFTLGFFVYRFIQNDTIESADDIETVLGVKNLAEVPVISEITPKTNTSKWKKGIRKWLRKLK